MTSLWGRRRKAAREAGEYHAEGGPDTRAHWVALHAGDSYDAGYKARSQEIEEIQARQTAIRDHPLNQIRHEAETIARVTDSSEVRELAELIERMAEYIMDREGDGK